jgi:aspartate/methionine/tyrosine aminotransferase
MSAIKEMAMLSARTKDAASLAWGLPSFQTPEYIRLGVIERLGSDEDIGKYALPGGLKEFRQQVVQRHQEETGVLVDANDHVMITAGNMQGMSILLRALINPGDEVILTDPCFSSHIQQIRLNEGVPVFWSLDEAHEWCLDVDRLPELITERTRALIIVSPSNPTGKIFSEQKLRRIGELARQHGFMIIIDDPYSLFTYENRERFFNLASVENLFEHMVYLYSFSKAYAMSGWRLGYMIAPAWLKQQVIKVHDLNLICAPRIAQVAGLVALSGDQQHLGVFESELAKRRALICDRLDGLSHVFEYHRPEGAYYIFPRIRVEHEDAYEFCLRMLDQVRVTLTPGSAFGPSGEHHVRMAYCVSEQTINLAFDRMEQHFGKA